MAIALQDTGSISIPTVFSVTHRYLKTLATIRAITATNTASANV
jgi:hypothetical protein